MFKKFMTEFKEFALKGNVMDMAVGVIVGAAFQNIVNSLTSSFINPLIGLITGGAKTDENGNIIVSAGKWSPVKGVEFAYGDFISAVVNFLVIALVLFLILKAVNLASAKTAALAASKLAAEKEEAAPTTKNCPYCKTDINIEAVRCPNCTTILDESAVPAAVK